MKIILFIVDALRYDVAMRCFKENMGILSRYSYLKSFDYCFSTSSWTVPSIVSIFSATFPFVLNPLTIKSRINIIEEIHKRYNVKTILLNSGNIFIDLSGISDTFLVKIPLEITSTSSYDNIGRRKNLALRYKRDAPQISPASKVYNSLFYIINKSVALRSLIKAMKHRYPYKPFISYYDNIIDLLRTKEDLILYVHIMDTHYPWTFTSYSEGKFKIILSRNRKDVVHKLYTGSAFMLLNLLFRLCKIILEQIDDKITIIVTSDHGEGFGKEKYDFLHEVYTPIMTIYTLYYDQLHIPLIFITNDDKMEYYLVNVKENYTVSNLDIIPSLLDVYFKNLYNKLLRRQCLNGVSIFQMEDHGRPYIVAETPALKIKLEWFSCARTVIHNNFKLTVHPILGCKVTDLKIDPYEQMIGCYIDNDITLSLFKILRAHVKNEVKTRIRLKALSKLTNSIRYSA